MALFGCGDTHRTEPDNLILYGGMEVPSAWRLGNAVIHDGVLSLCVENESDIAIASQMVPPLAGEGVLLLSLRARSHGATDGLNLDLYGFGRDSPLQQLVIQTGELSGEFQRYAALIRSGSSDMGIWLRVFTSSMIPIDIDEIVLRRVPPPPPFYGGHPCTNDES